MMPLLSTLLAEGLTILSGAIVSKGKDAIEKHLGVDVETLLGSEEGKLKLKQLEIEYEEFLLNQALEENKMYFQDVSDARKLGVELAQSSSWLNQNIMPILALLTIICSGMLLWWSTETDVKMASVSFITMVLGYFFGSSKGSKDKQELLSKMEMK